MTIDRAIEILDPEHRECYDGLEEVNEACRMGMEALERCQKCIFYDPANCSNWCSHHKGLCNPGESDFCSYGKEPHR